MAFARRYAGQLATETMLVEGVNDGEDCLREVAAFLGCLQDANGGPNAGKARPIAYLSIPTRPPAEKWVHAPGEGAINRAYQILSGQVQRVEYLIGYEGNAFASTGHVEEDLLNITAVHPMREDAVQAFLARAGADGSVVHRLIDQGQLVETTFRGQKFYMRRLNKGQSTQ
jgi:wyosine [tRNA(Phe)-imidazoG37] synthetase (radical SAM superfamily)